MALAPSFLNIYENGYQLWDLRTRGYDFHARVPLTLWVKFGFLNDLIFAVGTRGENLHFLDANYSIKHNSNVQILTNFDLMTLLSLLWMIGFYPIYPILVYWLFLSKWPILA